MKKSQKSTTESKAFKRAAKRSVKTRSGTEKFKKFMKRYWYWPVTLLVLAGGILGWCYGLGYFDESIKLVYEGPETIDLYINSYYNLGAKTNGGEIIKYYVDKGFEDIISVDSLGKVYGKDIGIGRVVVEAGNIKKKIYVNVNKYVLIWVLEVGDMITQDNLFNGAGKHVKGINQFLFNTTMSVEENTSIFEYHEGTKKTDWWYDIIKEGQGNIILLSNDVEVCEVQIYAYKNLEEGQRQFNLEPQIYELNTALDTSKIERTVEIFIGEEYFIEPSSFNEAGYLYFHSSNPGILNLWQNGGMKGNAEGTTIVSILCTGTQVIKNYKIHVNINETLFYKLDLNNAQRDVYINDIIKERELLAFYADERLYEYKTASDAFNVYYDENGEKCFEAVKLTDDKDAYIIAYDKNGIALCKFKVNIIEEPEDE